jgi:hypothetical protein
MEQRPDLGKTNREHNTSHLPDDLSWALWPGIVSQAMRLGLQVRHVL